MNLGAGWRLVHLSDRTIELRKDDAIYRKVVGRDGYVRLRSEPGVSRETMLTKAVEMAQRNDARLAEIVARQIVPRRLGGYQMRQQGLAHAFGTPEEPEIIGVRRP